MAESDFAVSLGTARYIASQYEVIDTLMGGETYRRLFRRPTRLCQGGSYGIADSGNSKWRGIDGLFGVPFLSTGQTYFCPTSSAARRPGIGKFVSLPLRVAVLPTTDAAITALARIDSARRNRTGIVNLMDLENAHVNEDDL